LPFRTGLFVLAAEEPGHAQVVARLAIVARAADDVPEPGHGVVVTLERDGQTAGRLRESDARGETPEAVLIRVHRTQELALELLLRAELHEPALAPSVGRRNAVRGLRPDLDLGAGYVVVPALGVGHGQAAAALHDLHRVTLRPRQARVALLEDGSGREVERVVREHAAGVLHAQPAAPNVASDVQADEKSRARRAGRPLHVQHRVGR